MSLSASVPVHVIVFVPLQLAFAEGEVIVTTGALADLEISFRIVVPFLILILEG